MITLALDTATRYTSVALLDGEEVLAEGHEPAKSHSASLIPSIDGMMKDSGVSIHDLDIIGVGIGPGSFTGVRIGLTVAKTLAFAHKLPLVGVCSLLALAYNGQEQGEGAVICPALDALKGEVYGASYRLHGLDLLELQAPAARDPKLWARQLLENDESVYLLGSALEKYEDAFRAVLGQRLSIPQGKEGNIISAGHVGRVALRTFQKQGPDDPKTIEPMYCRLSEAELVKKKKN